MDDIRVIVNGIPRRNVSTRDQRSYLKKELGPRHIKITFNPHDGRTAFTVHKRNGPLSEESKPFIGYILDLTNQARVNRVNGEYPVMKQAPQPTILAAIPHPVIDQYVHQEVADDPGLTLTPISDGSILTMYWFNKQWRFSTISSYDYGPMSWSEDETNGDLIEEVLQECKFDLDKLDTNKCYTIGVKGRSHPFLEGTGKTVYKMWFIRSVDVAKLNKALEAGETKDSETPKFDSFVSTNEDLGIPIQEEIKIPMSEVLANNSNAYENFLKTGEVNYGYIATTSNGDSYLMDSDLYRYVRHIFYDAPVPGTRHDRRRGRSHVNIYPKDRHLFCTLHAMLSTRHVEVFPKLFPQFADDVKFIKDELASMHKSLVASYTQHIKVNQENKKLSTEPIPMSSVGRSKKK